VVAGIIKGAEQWSASDSFKAEYELARLKRVTEQVWQDCDCLLLPTAPTIFTHAEIKAEPVARNAKLGLYTNFVNLLDLAAIAVPAGFRADRMPFGVSLIAPAFTDHALAGLADRLHRSLPDPRWGGSSEPLPPARPPSTEPSRLVTLAVVGAHLSGQPLNHQLLDRRARLIGTSRTAPGYRLYALSGTIPPKPGLMRDPTGAGLIEVELWELDSAAFGSFTALIPPPLGIGTLLLEDGSSVKGFICEAAGLEGARDITGFGGWRAYQTSVSG
jgi:allophanate hydrolase